MLRTVMIAAAVLTVAGTADGQQRMVMPGPGPGAPYSMPRDPALAPYPGQHWGGRVNGVWVGGAHAPGGYAAYRRPYRGYQLSSYWLQPGFTVSDWSLYGLRQPPYGYRWARYYDDAVLIDRRGIVADTVSGLDWDRFDLDGPGGSYDDRRYGGADFRRRRPRRAMRLRRCPPMPRRRSDMARAIRRLLPSRPIAGTVLMCRCRWLRAAAARPRSRRARAFRAERAAAAITTRPAA